MDKVGELCSRDKDLLYEFSKRTLKRLSSRSPLLLPLPIFQKYMDMNVMKEVEKDRLIVEHAAAVFSGGREIGPEDVDEVFETTKDVDRVYVRRLSIPSLSIKVRYEDIAEIRKQRIDYLSRAVFSLLSAWKDAESFEDAVKKTYSAEGFREAITEILHLYNIETRKLNRSIKLIPPFHMAMEAFAEALFRTMEEVAKDMVDGCAKRIYGGAGHPCLSPI